MPPLLVGIIYVPLEAFRHDLGNIHGLHGF